MPCVLLVIVAVLGFLGSSSSGSHRRAARTAAQRQRPRSAERTATGVQIRQLEESHPGPAAASLPTSASGSSRGVARSSSSSSPRRTSAPSGFWGTLRTVLASGAGRVRSSREVRDARRFAIVFVSSASSRRRRELPRLVRSRARHDDSTSRRSLGGRARHVRVLPLYGSRRAHRARVPIRGRRHRGGPGLNFMESSSRSFSSRFSRTSSRSRTYASRERGVALTTEVRSSRRRTVGTRDAPGSDAGVRRAHRLDRLIRCAPRSGDCARATSRSPSRVPRAPRTSCGRMIRCPR